MSPTRYPHRSEMGESLTPQEREDQGMYRPGSFNALAGWLAGIIEAMKNPIESYNEAVDYTEGYDELEDVEGAWKILIDLAVLKVWTKMGPGVTWGPMFVEFLKVINIPALTGVDGRHLEEGYAHLEDAHVVIPLFKIEVFGYDLSLFLPIEGSESWNDEGKQTTWPKLLLYAVIVFLITGLAVLIGGKAPMLAVHMLGAFISAGSALYSSISQRAFKQKVLEGLESLEADHDYITRILESGEWLSWLQALLSVLGKIHFI